MTYSIQTTTSNVTTTSLPNIFSQDDQSLGRTTLAGGNTVSLQMGELPNSHYPALYFSVSASVNEWGTWTLVPEDILHGLCHEGMTVALPDGGFAIAYTTSYFRISAVSSYVRVSVFDAEGKRVGSELSFDAFDADLKSLSAAADGTLSVIWTVDNVTSETIVKNGPTTTSFTATIDEDGAHTFSASHFAFSSDTGATLAAVTIESLPGKGLLTLSGVAVHAGDRIAIEDIHELVWTPEDDAHGDQLATLRFRVVDSDGVLSGEHLLGFNVNGVDDTPEAKADRSSAREGDIAVINPLANDIDADGDALTIDAASVVSGEASLKITKDGRLAVTYLGPDLSTGETAQVTVAYTVTDGSFADDATLVVTFKGHAETTRVLAGSAQADSLAGTDRAEHIQGRQARDSIDGGGGADLIRGGSGNDRLAGGAGNDTLVGGDGRDEFVFDAADRSDDIVTDFRPGEDKIVLTGFDGIRDFADIAALLQTEGANVVIRLDASNSITLLATDAADLASTDFLL